MTETKYRGAWSNRPDALDPSQALRELTADVVICGAGIAGITCALRAAQKGVSVIVLEKTAGRSARGGNIGVPNSSFMRSLGIENDPEDVAREWIKRCGNRCDERIVWKYLKSGERAMDWLIDIVTSAEYGAEPALQGCLYNADTYKEIIGSHRFFNGPMARKGARPGASDAVYAMYNEALKLGVRFVFNAPAEQLCQQDGKVLGVFAKTGEGLILAKASTGVVLATGDIGGNDEMCAELSPIANRVAQKIYSPKGANTGDGHRMGYWAGGAFEDGDFPCVLHTQAFFLSNFCFLFVTPNGRRFMNEDSYVQGKSIAIIREGYKYAWAIADSDWEQKVLETLPYGGGLFWGHDCVVGEVGFDIELEREMLKTGVKTGNVVVSDTPEGLAEKMKIPVAAFTETFENYGRITEQKKDSEFGKRKELLIPLDKPPYYAMKFGPALLAVVGGLKINEHMNVLNDDRKIIEGLYAVGNTAGGRYGVDYPMLIPGNSHGTALTLAFLLGEELAG
jgi:succinate dehydrogenase/fumarate reductase flavoprotein subunit